MTVCKKYVPRPTLCHTICGSSPRLPVQYQLICSDKSLARSCSETNLYKRECFLSPAEQNTTPNQKREQTSQTTTTTTITTARARTTHFAPAPNVPIVQPKNQSKYVKNVCKFQSLRARLARRQWFRNPWSRRASLGLRGPPDGRKRRRTCCGCCSRPRPFLHGRPQRDHLPHHRLPSERAKRVGR